MKKKIIKNRKNKSREKETKILTIAFWSITLVLIAVLISFLVTGLGTKWYKYYNCCYSNSNFSN